MEKDLRVVTLPDATWWKLDQVVQLAMDTWPLAPVWQDLLIGIRVREPAPDDADSDWLVDCSECNDQTLTYAYCPHCGAAQ